MILFCNVIGSAAPQVGGHFQVKTTLKDERLGLDLKDPSLARRLQAAIHPDEFGAFEEPEPACRASQDLTPQTYSALKALIPGKVSLILHVPKTCLARSCTRSLHTVRAPPIVPQSPPWTRSAVPPAGYGHDLTKLREHQVREVLRWA